MFDVANVADGGYEMSEAVAQLRWVPKSMLQAMDLKLQQAYRITVYDSDRRALGTRMEWRDVPTVRETREK